jgi:hypothetical protein
MCIQLVRSQPRVTHDPADVIDREAATAWGVLPVHHMKPTTGANAMRSLLAFGLLIAVCASATAAHSRPRHHHGYGSYGGYSGHNSSQWGGQPD